MKNLTLRTRESGQALFFPHPPPFSPSVLQLKLQKVVMNYNSIGPPLSPSLTVPFIWILCPIFSFINCLNICLGRLFERFMQNVGLLESVPKLVLTLQGLYIRCTFSRIIIIMSNFAILIVSSQINHSWVYAYFP